MMMRKLPILGLALILPCVGKAAADCQDWVAKVMSIQGRVENQTQLAGSWQMLNLGNFVCPGDKVRVAKLSRASLLLRNDSVISLDQNTTMTFSPSPTQQQPWMLKLFEGTVFFRSRQSQQLEVQTPFINAVHQGTEFAVSVNSRHTFISVFDGSVNAQNAQGKILIKQGYQGIASSMQAPRIQILSVNPQDAVQWTLYYPPVFEFSGDAQQFPKALRAVLEAYQQGQSESVNRLLEAMPSDTLSSQALLFKASLYLSVGRIEEANVLIQDLLKVPATEASAYALQAIVAVTQNHPELALKHAKQAVRLKADAVEGFIALSYAEQALFKLDAAIQSAEQATKLAPVNALAWARFAELSLAKGEQVQALQAAHTAEARNPHLAKVQVVLGFAALNQAELSTAERAFDKAIFLDSADPLSRVGLGLVKIRNGALVEGKQQLEVAVNLDPNNAIIRSYLGKAFYELKNKDFAAKEYALAQAFDNKDPTPWFYSAILNQSTNRPVQALHDMQQAMALNDNRAIYRSRLLLDKDQAVRSAGLGRIYKELGFDDLARKQASDSLAADPSNYSAHRLLADSYLSRPRQEVARASEVLQAQLLQPLNYNPIQPQLAYTDLNIPKSAGFADSSFNEYSRSFEGNQQRFTATGLYGSNDTRADEAVFSGIQDKFAYSLGQMHYQTDGFRPNADLKHNLYNVFGQYQFSPQLSIQAEYRRRETEHGDIQLKGSSTKSDPYSRRTLEQDTYRLGGQYSPSQHSDFLMSFMYADRQEDVHTLAQFPVGPFVISGNVGSAGKQGSYQLESQYLFHDEWFNVVMGGSAFLTSSKRINERPNFPPQLSLNCTPTSCSDIDNYHDNLSSGYFYTTLHALKNISATAGLAYDYYSSDRQASPIQTSQLSPKFGLQWQVNQVLTLRAAAFQTVKAPIIVNQSLQPMQIAGFNQFFDDPNGTRATQYGVGADLKVSRDFYLGAEAYKRDLKLQLTALNEETFTIETAIRKREEELYRLYFNWLPVNQFLVSSELRCENFRGTRQDTYRSVESAYIPLNLHFFNEAGFFADIGGQLVHQAVVASDNPSSGQESFKNNFFLVDAAIGYRLPKQYGMISLEAKNLLDKNFKYRDRSYQMNEVRSSDLIPERLLFARITLNF